MTACWRSSASAMRDTLFSLDGSTIDEQLAELLARPSAGDGRIVHRRPAGGPADRSGRRLGVLPRRGGRLLQRGQGRSGGRRPGADRALRRGVGRGGRGARRGHRCAAFSPTWEWGSPESPDRGEGPRTSPWGWSSSRCGARATGGPRWRRRAPSHAAHGDARHAGGHPRPVGDRLHAHAAPDPARRAGRGEAADGSGARRRHGRLDPLVVAHRQAVRRAGPACRGARTVARLGSGGAERHSRGAPAAPGGHARHAVFPRRTAAGAGGGDRGRDAPGGGRTAGTDAHGRGRALAAAPVARGSPPWSSSTVRGSCPSSRHRWRARSAQGGWYEPERRRFLAHVTVARIGRNGPRQPPELPAPPAVSAAAASVSLYRSHTGPSGARYEPLATVRLLPGGPGLRTA